MSKNASKKTDAESEEVVYFAGGLPIKIPGTGKMMLSRLFFPVLSMMSREQSVKMGLTPIDDERVIIALKNTEGRLVDIGCGANNYVKSYKGEGVGVDVYPWKGTDVVVKDTAVLPFKDGEFDTISYLACVNHIPNREDVLKEGFRVVKPGGNVLVTMITPRWGRFIHWWRFRNDPDHQERDIDHDHELLGMAPSHVKKIMEDAGFTSVKRKKFVFGLNSLYIGQRK